MGDETSTVVEVRRVPSKRPVPRRSYQTRQNNRTALITLRVSPEEREMLHGLAQERGETLSRMLLEKWVEEARRASARLGAAAEAASASEPVAMSTPAAAGTERQGAPEGASARRWRGIRDRWRGVSARLRAWSEAGRARNALRQRSESVGP